MNFESLMNEVKKRVHGFTVKEETIYHVIELNDRWCVTAGKGKKPDGKGFHAIPASEIEENEERHECYLDIVDYLCLLSEKELQEMVCLMDFGRNLDYFGFSRDVAEAFIDNVDNCAFSHIKGRHGAEYLAGKVPLGKWLRLVMKQVKSASEPDAFYRITAHEWGSEGHTKKDYDDPSAAWAAFREMMIPDKYSFVSLVGYSLTGRAETHLAATNFGM